MKRILTLTDKDITGSEQLSSAKPRIAVNAVLFDSDGNIALSYMGQFDLYTLPGGGVEPGENLREAVQREVWEEAGCECEIICELGEIHENRAEHDFAQERSYYIAQVVGEKGELHLTDEETAANTAVVWITLEEALKIIAEKQHDNYQRRFIQRRDIAALTAAQNWLLMHDILGFPSFVTIEPINKGQSNDKKYRVEISDGKRLLLRVTDIAEYERKKAEYGMMTRAYKHGIRAPEPVDFGLCNGGNSVYSLSGWLDGEDAETRIPRMSEAEQYGTGFKAGAVLRKIHTLPAPENAESWDSRFRRKVQTRIDLYHEHHLQSENGEKIIKYLSDKQGLLKNRAQTFWHGDFNVGNHMITPEGEIATFDYNYWNLDYGDPWWDFVIIAWGEEPPAHYFTGMIDGYWDGDPPPEFFETLSYYYACDALSARCYTFLGMEEGSPEDGKRHMENILRWFDGMRNPVPTWYLKDYCIQWIDSVPYKLKAPFDFSFLGKYGTVFKVFDDQDSGNICFGTEKDGGRYFIKFAGAPTARAVCPAEEAIANLEAAVPIYCDLAHPNLIKLLADEHVGGGYAAVFEWADGECMGRMYPASHRKFMAMPIEAKLRVFDDILTFHLHVSEQGYAAIDFYDGSIMFDLAKGNTTICDIDFYAKRPYINRMGRLWGSSRYMSPEEFTLGAEIDEVTNVYAMGATAFALFSEYDRTPEKWPLGERLYAVAKRAVSDSRDARQQSIRQLIDEWMEAKLRHTS